MQGISVGWADVYSQSLDGQSINITGLPNGNYWLEVSADVADAILETNETNNTTRLAITISGQPTVGFRVQSGTPTGTNNTPVSFVDLRFNQPVNSATFTPADVVLTTPNGTVAVTSITTVDASNYRINFPTQGSIGTYTVTVGPDISNLSGQKLDQNNNGVGGEAADFFYNIFTVVAPRLLSVSPAGTVAPPVNTIRVTYTKPMASATFTTADLVSFTGPGGTSLLGEVTGIVPFVAGPSSAIFDVTLKAR